MGSPGPRAFGSDVIETARCGASPCATRPRSGRSLWQEQVLLVDDQARSIDCCDALVPRRDRHVRPCRPIYVSASVFVAELMEEDTE